ncbi:unnamed protein product [Orchesella dallaii]|uniref:PRKR-like endoplasmic reticulum kinase n=1 Tax=Orchesella dallaii TaxID=48710 RepID=A0ABP1R8F4_9HEXA
MYFLGHLGSSNRSLIVVGLVCVCIVTVGFVYPVRGQMSDNVRKVRSPKIEMGQKKSSEQMLGSELKVEFPEETKTVYKHHQFDHQEYVKNLEDRLLANQNGFQTKVVNQLNEDEDELKNPHPHISVPQLPFCKPTRSTVGSESAKDASSKEKKKTKEKRSVDSHDAVYGDGLDHDDDADDIEVINASEAALKADRKFLVATLDGKVTLLNRTGHQLWTVKTGPLFSSTISSLQLNENGKWINLIPSLTGGVYKYDGDSLYPMPFNADSLLKKSFKLSNDVVITGGKELRTFGIDVKSGNIRYECGIAGCVIPGDAEVNASGNDSEDAMVLVVKKQIQTVRAIDSSTGAERWNFSVGTHEMALAGVTEGCYHGEQRDNSRRISDFLKIVIPEGRVFGADRENHVVWDQTFESPISQVWILENGQLVSVDPITNTPLTDVPSLYIGIHNQQFYVQESQTTSEKMERIFGLDEAASLRRKPFNIAWKPAAAIDGVSGSTALSTITPTPNWVSFSPTPNFSPIFVYEKDSVGDPLADPLDLDEDDDDSRFDEELNPDINFDDGITQVIVMSLWFWWKEVLGISLLTAVLLNLILMKPIMRAVRGQAIREVTVYFQQLWNRWKEEEESRALLARTSSNLLSLPAPEEPDTSTENRKRSTSSSSTGSFHSPVIEDRGVNFSSQYLSEFIPIECLGRGGFGVVFEAKKKIDDRTYAVKRIALPHREKAQARVKREVIALAQLDHRHIVRYFNAWTECTPVGWLEKNDPLWARTLIGSTCPTDYPSDIFASSMMIEASKHGRPDHSKISLPNTPSEQPNDDSFIVFDTTSSSSCSKNTVCSLETSPLINPIPEEDLIGTSIQIPSSEDNSTASSTSGVGFFRRPTSLNMNSTISSFHDHEDVSYQKAVSVSIAANQFSDEEKSKHANEEDEDEKVDISEVMYLYIQQELCQKRTLQDWLRSESLRELPLVVNLFSQIVEAVEYVHSKKLIHRDLKPSNIFLAEVTENGFGVLNVKIGDFGLATTAYAEMESEKVAATPLGETDASENVKMNLTGHVGTHLYMSPEQYHRKPYDYKVDIYSLGLIFFELLMPFSTDMERYNILTGVRKLNFPEKFRDSFPDEYDLIRTMISHDPNERPDAGRVNAWVKTHILKVPGTSIPRIGGSEPLVGRSISSPAEILRVDKSNSPDRKKLKLRFFKTQSVT